MGFEVEVWKDGRCGFGCEGLDEGEAEFWCYRLVGDEEGEGVAFAQIAVAALVCETTDCGCGCSGDCSCAC